MNFKDFMKANPRIVICSIPETNKPQPKPTDSDSKATGNSTSSQNNKE